MALTVDYYFAPQSPWTYLGHERFCALTKQYGATVRVLPVDLGGQVFPVSGGLPLSRRAPQRQAYRLLELRRYADWLKVPLNPEPRFFPVPGDDASQLIIAVDERDGTEAALRITGAVLAAVWANELNIADEKVLSSLLVDCGLPAERWEQSHTQAVHERYEEDSRMAIEAGVFGAPSYVVDGEIFWGQDRLDFLERRLQRG